MWTCWGKTRESSDGITRLRVINRNGNPQVKYPQQQCEPRCVLTLFSAFLYNVVPLRKHNDQQIPIKHNIWFFEIYRGVGLFHILSTIPCSDVTFLAWNKVYVNRNKVTPRKYLKKLFQIMGIPCYVLNVPSYRNINVMSSARGNPEYLHQTRSSRQWLKRRANFWYLTAPQDIRDTKHFISPQFTGA
jgi:hypothetical protein